ncbi:cytochrome C oxidase subunit IV [Novosphingobium sp. PC22D]|nr:cytochrome C oxidase subunit IV [Novosphingobium sp. PC22D]
MATGHDMKTANSTYEGFLTLFKWGTILSVIVAAFVVFLIAS